MTPAPKDVRGALTNVAQATRLNEAAAKPAFFKDGKIEAVLGTAAKDTYRQEEYRSGVDSGEREGIADPGQSHLKAYCSMAGDRCDFGRIGTTDAHKCTQIRHRVPYSG